MKKSIRSRRDPTELNEVLRRRLEAYALAAGAAGVGLLGLAQPAGAEIVYTPTHHVIQDGESYGIDLNGDGIMDVTIFAFTVSTSEGARGYLIASGAPGNQVMGYPWFASYGPPLQWASALRPGQRVSGSQTRFGYGRGTMAIGAQSGGGTNSYAAWGNLPLIPYRYLGIKFQISGQTHYGWARMIVKVSRTNATATLTGYAYETEPNQGIVLVDESVGEESGSAESPDMTENRRNAGTLGRLARGSTGLPWRTRNGAIQAIGR